MLRECFNRRGDRRGGDLSGRARRRGAFTLVELLVVMGLILGLMAVLVSTAYEARRQANMVRCASNLRQLALAMEVYQYDHQALPPTASSGGLAPWTKSETFARYLNSSRVTMGDQIGGPVLQCPDDLAPAWRSYSMNVYASSVIEPAVLNRASWGIPWRQARAVSSKMILLTESWSYLTGSPGGFVTRTCVGDRPQSPGMRFGGAGGFPLNAHRFGMANSDLAFNRHRKRLEGRGTEPRGAINIAYMDGHVELKRHSELVHPNGKSTFDSLWSKLDYEIDR